MIRSVMRSLARLLAAIVLLVLLLCAVEVALRVSRLQHRLARTEADPVRIALPHPTRYLDVVPLLDQPRAAATGAWILIRTNEFGLREQTVTVPKPRGVYRILCLGGENLFGPDVQEEQTVTRQLQELLSGYTQLEVEVLNGGCPGAGPLVHLLRLRQQLLSLQPDLVVLCLHPEEVHRDRQVLGTVRLDHTDLPAFAIHPRHASQGSELINGLCEEFVTLDWMIGLTGETLGLRAGTSVSPPSESGSGDLSPVSGMHRLVTSGYGSFAVSIIPHPALVEPQSREGPSPDAMLEGQLLHAMQTSGLADQVPIDNAVPVFRQFPEAVDLFLPDSEHLSPRGNLLYAQTLARMILTHIPGVWTIRDEGRAPSDER